MRGNTSMKFAGPCPSYLPKPLHKRKDNIMNIPCPVWISKEVLSAFPPSMISNQTKKQLGKEKDNVMTSVTSRTKPDLIAWEHAPESDGEDAAQRDILRPRRLFGPTRTRNGESEPRGRTFASMAPPPYRNLTVPDVLAELSGSNQLPRSHFAAWQQHPPTLRGAPFDRQSCIQIVPSPGASYHENAAALSTDPGLLLRQDRPATSSERELRRETVSSRSPYDLAQRLKRAIRALEPSKWNRSSPGILTPDDPLIHKGGENDRRTPRTLGRRLGRAVRALESQAHAKQTESLLSSREKSPLKCGGDATSKFNAVPPMNTRTSRKRYCEICNERNANSIWNSPTTPSFQDPIEMIHFTDFCGGYQKQYETPTSKARKTRDAQKTPDFPQGDYLFLPLQGNRCNAATPIKEHPQLPRAATSPSHSMQHFRKVMENAATPQPPRHCVPRNGRRRLSRDEGVRKPRSPMRTWKPPPRGCAPARPPARRKRPPVGVDKGVQVCLPLRSVGGREKPQGIQRKKKRPKASSSPKMTLKPSAPYEINDPKRRNHQPVRRRKARKRSPKQTSRRKELSTLINEQKKKKLSKDYLHITLPCPGASRSNELLLRTSASTSSDRSIFSIQKLQDMMSVQNDRQYNDDWRFIYGQISRPSTPRYKILQY